MTVVQVNATCSAGSTGKICASVSDLLTEKGHKSYVFYAVGSSKHPAAVPYSKRGEIKTQAMLAHLYGDFGFRSSAMTMRLIKELDRLQPDIVHIHNIHSHNINLELLVSYLKYSGVKTVMTFHDCWLFTGYCTYFDRVGCDKWKIQCESCAQYRQFSFLFDRSKMLYNRKKELLNSFEFTIVTPSCWLKELVAQSFLKRQRTTVIHNGIDLDIFQPTQNSVKEQYGIGEKKLLLGVSYFWDTRKGLADMLKLTAMLGDGYRLMLVGTHSASLPEDVISIPRTRNQKELAALYSAADCFVNTTYEDNFPTVNIEALACGTPVVTYDTGGSAEIIDPSCGIAVPKGNQAAMKAAVEQVCKRNCYTAQSCRTRARQFDKNDKYNEYLNLYEELMNE